jgi:predicted RNase H-like nuclease
MSWVAGVDGCKKRWFRICRETGSGELTFNVIETVEGLVIEPPGPEIVSLDMPIGLPRAGSRDCDLAARKCLKERRNSVFPAPIRAAVTASSREEASVITSQIDGRRVAAQAWAIYPKIRAVDEALASSAAARAAIREVHPEVSFWAWNGRRPMAFPKKKADGLAERLALVEEWLGGGILARARGDYLKRDLADDDILDAIAGLWTAHRIAAGKAETLPASPPRDETGLPIEIVF